jgi:hypothetical protein
MSLNLEVDRADGVQDGYIILNIMVQSSGILNTVWLQLQKCNCGDSRATTAFLANYHEKFGGKMRKEMSFPKGHRHGTVLRIPRKLAQELLLLPD